MRKRKLLLNTSTSLLNQLIAMICGFILPKLFLKYYGSDVNGLISSITQFLAIIAFLELGVGAVVQSSLYKPLADKDSREISKIIKSSDKFFKKIAIILLVYTSGLAIIYPIITLNSFNYIYTFSLIIIISISQFAQYYLGITYQLLLNADQKSYVQLVIQIITTIVNTLGCYILITQGASIHLVKFMTSTIFIIRPLFMIWYIKKNYKIDKKIVLTEEPIKQKWNGLAQHLAAVVLTNTDIIVLTMLSTLKNVSIYTVYNLVVTGVKQLIVALTTGTSALLGNMLANNEKKLLEETFEKFEVFMHFIVVLMYTCTSVLIIPFVRVYTYEITDANYIAPIFAILITMAQASYCLRLPYNTLVLAAGHYKETQTSAIIEMTINIIVSVIGVIKYGLIGVAIGTLMAMLYRTLYLVNYLRKNIINRSLKKFIKLIIVDFIVVIFSLITVSKFNMSVSTYIELVFLGVKVGSVVFIICLVVYVIAYYKKISIKNS